MDYKLLTKPSSPTKRQKRVLAHAASTENSILKFARERDVTRDVIIAEC